MEVRLESDWSRGLVPKQITSALVGFRTIPLWMNQLLREDHTPLEAAETAR